MRYKFITHILSASALTLVMGAPVYAQQQYEDPAMQQQEPTVQQDSSMQPQAEADFANSYKSSSLQDLDVNDMQGETIGKIDDVLIDSEGNVSHVVVSEEGGLLGGGGQNYVIPWDQLQIDDQQQTASIDVSKDQLSTEFSAFEELPPTKLERDEAQQPPDEAQQPGDMQQQPEEGGMGESPDSSMQ